MPIYDLQCQNESCGWVARDVWEVVAPLHRAECPDCGSPTARAWLSKPAAVVGDECDFTQVNGARHPIRFRSKAEHARWLKENGYRIKDTHVGDPGSDKSKHTRSWATLDPQTIENARYLVTHRAMIDAEEVDEPLHITFSEGYLTPEQAKVYSERNR